MLSKLLALLLLRIIREKKPVCFWI